MKSIGVLAGFLLCLVSASANADLGAFTIRDFDVHIQVHENSDLTITERIVVEFSAPRRGIYREIPIRYTDPTGFQYGYGFRLLSVEDENLVDFTASGLTHVNADYAEVPNRYRVAGPVVEPHFGVVEIDWESGPLVSLKVFNASGEIRLDYVLPN